MVSELLKKAEILTERDPGGRAVTYNNLACFSRQQGRLHASLTFLQRALKIEQRLKHVDNPADTHLNLCAVLSQLKRHEEALSHAQSALALLQDELFGGPGGAAAAAQKPDRIAVLAIAYHNLGVEHEFLKQFTASLQSYTKGVEIASVYLGAAHGITGTLRASQLAAAKCIEDAKRAAEAKEKEKERARAAAGNSAAAAAHAVAAQRAGSPSRRR
jgi:tetratricopeptide (TPR) repeat protein